MPVATIQTPYCRAVYRNFAKGGRIWGMDKRGGARRAEAQWYHVRCYTLGGGENDTFAPPPPLKYGPALSSIELVYHNNHNSIASCSDRVFHCPNQLAKHCRLQKKAPLQLDESVVNGFLQLNPPTMYHYIIMCRLRCLKGQNTSLSYQPATVACGCNCSMQGFTHLRDWLDCGGWDACSHARCWPGQMPATLTEPEPEDQYTACDQDAWLVAHSTCIDWENCLVNRTRGCFFFFPLLVGDDQMYPKDD